MPATRPFRASGILFASILLLSACASPTVRPLLPANATDVEPEVYKAKGPPRPPDRSELETIGEVPSGNVMIEGLPGSNPRVNQDASGEAQNETTIVANPTNPLNLVGAWNDYFAVNAGQNTVIGYGWSTDGGATWQSSRVDFSTLPTTQSTGDPALAVDSLGNVYLGILAYGSTADGILVAKSTDGGATFAEPVRLDDGGDKEFLTVDPATNAIYVVWMNGGIYFSRSTDLGVTYTPRLEISSPTTSGNGAYPAVGPNGEIYVMWGNFNDRLYFDRSLDGGDTWLADDILIDGNIVAPRSPLLGGFRNPEIGAIAVDRTGGPDHGRIYVVWPDQRFGDPDILLSYSDDQGDTWSSGMRVNDDAVGNDADQFFPWVAVDDNGHVHVTFLDRRDDFDGMLLAMYLATSTDGGLTFGPNIRISDGIYGPSNFGFLGDYTGAAVASDNRIHPLWPDGRNGEEDVFTKSVDLADYDGDGILNDGDGDGQYANNRCTGGQTASCDDNCPGEPNVLQTDADSDLVGDACDNCVDDFNPSQADIDRDGIGEACDLCPGIVGGDDSDPDSDGLGACVDNCPEDANVFQEDGDSDGVGDACDPCPGSTVNDDDADGLCGDVDNCAFAFNPLQVDQDSDGVGDLCDVCPGAFDPTQDDADSDGAGDLCDCQISDPTDREPGAVELTVSRVGATDALLAWAPVVGADAYSVTRGTVASLGPGEYGECLFEGVDGLTFQDTAVPAPGEVFFYIVQAQSFDCALGPLGLTSAELPRSNANPAACQGISHTDTYPDGESPVSGTVDGSFLDTTASDDVAEAITEEETNGAPIQRVNFLEHHWSVQIPAAGRVELHVEGFRTSGLDGDDFVFEVSTDGGVNWDPVVLASFPFADDDTDLQGVLAPSLSGPVLFRVVDTDRTPGGGSLDTVSIDEMFVRTAP